MEQVYRVNVLVSYKFSLDDTAIDKWWIFVSVVG